MQGNQKGLFEFQSVKFQTFIEPPKQTRDEAGNLILIDKQ